MQEVLKQWKATLQKEKRKLRVKQLEALSNEPPTLEEVTQLVDCDKVWVDFDEVCTRAKCSEPVGMAALNWCSLLMTATTSYKSYMYQRPGAIANCTFDELEAAKLVIWEGAKVHVYMISVHDHRLGGRGQPSWCWMEWISTG